MAKEYKLPDLGEGVESGEVARVLVSKGDRIEAEQTILELETDKALVEVPAPEAGEVVSVGVSDGDTVPVGAVLITYEASGAEAPSEGEAEASEEAEDKEQQDASSEEKTGTAEAPEGAEPEEPAEETEAEPEGEEKAGAAPEPEEPKPSAPRGPAPQAPDAGALPAAPATRRFARELGVDLAQIQGTGAGGRITREDVKAYVQDTLTGKPSAGATLAAPPELPDFTKYGETERQKLSKVRRVIAENLQVAWTQAPHVTQFDRADVTDLEAFRQRHKNAVQERGGRLTPTVLILKAVVNALKAFPQFNASLDVEADELILKRYYNIGIAVDTERGLLVPVIKNADRKDMVDLSIELNDLAERTRNGKAELAELQGGSFTITNLGSISGTAFTPIVNHPEVAILGIAQSREEPVVREGRVEPRLIMPLCLSYDHRVIDGADGARFTKFLVQSLQDPERLLLGG